MLSSRTLFGKKSGEDDDTNIMDFLGRGRVSGMVGKVGEILTMAMSQLSYFDVYLNFSTKDNNKNWTNFVCY